MEGKTKGLVTVKCKPNIHTDVVSIVKYVGGTNERSSIHPRSDSIIPFTAAFAKLIKPNNGNRFRGYILH